MFAIAATVAGCTHPARLTVYDHDNRPSGYHWIPRRIAQSRYLEFYGVDPSNGRTVYVGPDGIYYSFAHPPPITRRDLRSFWEPHDAATPSPQPAAR